jgi:hypothetical protein
VGWTRIDLTVVDQGGKGDYQYECELEIADTAHFMNYANDPLNMKKLIRKFLLN